MSRLNILMLTYDQSMANFGVTTAVSQLADQMACRYDDLHIVIGHTDDDPVIQDERVVLEKLPVHPATGSWRWSPVLYKAVEALVDRYAIDVIHIHGIWFAIQWIGLRIAGKRNIPIVVSIHGMLEPWVWNNKGLLNTWKKKFYFKQVFLGALPKHAIIHVITGQEKDTVSSLIAGYSIRVVHNAIDVLPIDADIKHEGRQNIILYLGRLLPVKGVDLLIEAFRVAGLSDAWELVIAGPDRDAEYVASLKRYVEKHEMASRVSFVGAVYGEEKMRLLHRAWVVAVPSQCEVVGMVNLEAAIMETPTITTFQTGLHDWQDGGGMLVNPNADELAQALRAVCGWDAGEREHRGKASYALVRDRYSWEVVAGQWRKLYYEAKR